MHLKVIPLLLTGMSVCGAVTLRKWRAGAAVLSSTWYAKAVEDRCQLYSFTQEAVPDPAAALLAVEAGPERVSAVIAPIAAAPDVIRPQTVAAPVARSPAVGAAGAHSAPAPLTPAQAEAEEEAVLASLAASAAAAGGLNPIPESNRPAQPYDPLPDLLRLQRRGADANGDCDPVAVLSRRSGAPGFAAVAASFRRALLISGTAAA